jgi:hypothetical protein
LPDDGVPRLKVGTATSKRSLVSSGVSAASSTSVSAATLQPLVFSSTAPAEMSAAYVSTSWAVARAGVADSAWIDRIDVDGSLDSTRLTSSATRPLAMLKMKVLMRPPAL